ncbi:hypothetical protein [Erysipelothrix aquatica]|uniref:hypothetical protein n=1 Tax=Erysipelothrix aquatica TaxID=2683714 RepID=UPI001356E707|nr:hypothetical protein [Erysipelothrix aquatica]
MTILDWLSTTTIEELEKMAGGSSEGLRQVFEFFVGQFMLILVGFIIVVGFLIILSVRYYINNKRISKQLDELLWEVRNSKQ